MPINLLQRTALGVMQLAPRSVTWRFSRRYIAGQHLRDAFETTATLNARDLRATIDVLGEDSVNADQVQSTVALYLKALHGIRERRLNCGVSVKLSGLGLRFDPDGCEKAMRELLSRAAATDTFVRIDMEDSTVTTETLELYRRLRAEFDNVGTVLQSCLHRSAADAAALLSDGPTDIRLCKGIYIEPESIAYRDADDIRAAFKRLLVQLFEGGATRLGIATHDVALVDHALSVIRDKPIDKRRYEFQMLLGVAEPLRNRLVSEGHPVRVYVPFGERWFEYSMRRLRENPNIARHIVRNLVRK